MRVRIAGRIPDGAFAACSQRCVSYYTVTDVALWKQTTANADIPRYC